MRRRAERKREKNRRRIWVGAGFLLAVFAAGGVYYFVRSKDAGADVAARALSVNASRGDLSSAIVGSGHLQSAKAQEVQAPAGLLIESVAVEAGDTVSAGDVLAMVNEAALTAQVAQIQGVIADLDEQIQENDGESDSQYVTSKVAGRVKKIYAQAGDDVADVMVTDGALLLLSLDGKMAVQIETEEEIEAGAAVGVETADGTSVSGAVKSHSDGVLTITLTDDGMDLGEAVTVTSNSGQTLGTGTLYVHQPLEITGTSGVTAAVHVTENQWVEAGESLLTLTEEAVSAECQELLAVRAVYKEKLKELLTLEKSCAITASTDGVIETVELTQGRVSSSSGSASSQENASENGGSSSIPATGMAYFGGQKSVLQKLSAEPFLEDGGVSANQECADEDSAHAPGAEDAQTEPQAAQEYADGESVNAHNEIKEESDPGAAQQDTGQQSGEQQTPVWQNGEQQNTGQENVQPQEAQQNAQESSAVLLQPVSGNSAEISSGASFDITDIQELQEKVTGFTIVAQDSMILSVDIDELDILSVEAGQQAQITMDAAEGKVFTGEVTQVSDSTSGSDGSAKYTVEITVPRDDSMRVGMSASATIVTEKRENAVILPADAVQERGRQTFVYTQYDPKSGALSGETQVQTGMSDGERVEIVSGLEEGVTVYYEKAQMQSTKEDRQENQERFQDNMFMPDKNGGEFGGSMPGGGMPEGAPGGRGGQ